MDVVTSPSRPAEDPGQQWTQPPFAGAPSQQPVYPQPSPQPGQQPPAQQYAYDPTYGQSPQGWNTQQNLTGGVIVPQPMQAQYPAVRVPPATPAEAIMRTIASVLFPAMIVLAIFGRISWLPAIIIALVVPGVLNRAAHDMKQRRIARAQYLSQPSQPPLPGPEDDLR